MVIESEVKELNISDLNEYEGSNCLLLIENEEGLWRKLAFDPSEVVSEENVLTIKDNKIVLTPKDDGGQGLVELTGAVTGSAALGTPVLTLLSSQLDINTNAQTFELNSATPTTFDYKINNASVANFSSRVTKDDKWIENHSDLETVPTFVFSTSDVNSGSWTIPANISDANGSAKISNDLSIGSEEKVFSVWQQGNDNIETSILDTVNNQWSPSEKISAGNNNKRPKISANVNDYALAVWEDNNGSEVAWAFYDPSLGQWVNEGTISGSADCAFPDVSINDSFDGVGVWSSQNGAQFELKVGIFSGNGLTLGWSNVEVISGAWDEITNIQVSIDNSGNAIAAYTVNDAGITIVYSTFYDATTQTWSAAVSLSDITKDAFEMGLSHDKVSGKAVCIWRAQAPGSNVIECSFFDESTKTWQAKAVLSDPAESCLIPSIDINSMGNAIASWTCLTPPQKIYGSYYDGSTTTWTTPTALDESALFYSKNTAAKISEHNEGMIANTRLYNATTLEQIMNTFYDANSNQWSSTTNITNVLDSYDEVKIVAKDCGFIVTWVVEDDQQNDFIVQGTTSLDTCSLMNVSKGNIHFCYNRLQSISEPVAPSDAATKNYVDNNFMSLKKELAELKNTLKTMGIVRW